MSAAADVRRNLRQSVTIHGAACELAAHGQSYIVRDAQTGRVLGRAMTRLLAVARAAVDVHKTLRGAQ